MSSLSLTAFFLRTLTIRPDHEAGTLGSSESEGLSLFGSEGDYRDEVVELFAGYAAERRYDPTANPDGSGSDNEKACEILALLGEEALEDEYRARADTFVAEHWMEIVALAEELFELEEISDPFEAEIIIDIARGEATSEDLATYRLFRDGNSTAT